MFINETTLWGSIFLLILIIFIYLPRTWLILLLTAELLWITLFFLILSAAYSTNNIYLFAFALYAILLSALEFATGLLLTTMTHLFLQTSTVEPSEQAVAAPHKFAQSALTATTHVIIFALYTHYL